MTEEKNRASENKQLSSDTVSLLRDKNLVFLATVMSDGSPQVTPTWVDFDEKNNLIVVNTARGRLKQKNITRDPRVAVAIVDRNNPYNVATIRGRVVEQTSQGANDSIDKLAKKYLGVEKYPFANPAEERVMLKIKPERIFHMKPN